MNGLRALILSWMFLLGLISTGLVGPNRTSIEGEYGFSHSAFASA